MTFFDFVVMVTLGRWLVCATLLGDGERRCVWMRAMAYTNHNWTPKQQLVRTTGVFIHYIMYLPVAASVFSCQSASTAQV